MANLNDREREVRSIYEEEQGGEVVLDRETGRLPYYDSERATTISAVIVDMPAGRRAGPCLHRRVVIEVPTRGGHVQRFAIRARQINAFLDAVERAQELLEEHDQ